MKHAFISHFLHKHQLPDSYADVAAQWFVPLAERILVQQAHGESLYCVGINGCQGSGKSTLADFIAEYLAAYGDLSVAVLSLDDFYYSSEKRQVLADTIHPLLRTRGVPGTHDTGLITTILDGLAKRDEVVSLPRFDKATDNPKPHHLWPTLNNVDVVLFEGWSWGVLAQPDSALIHPVNDLEAASDAEGHWRHYVNQQLRTHYAPLYDRMNYWVMLKAPSFEHVYKWRLQQEQKLAAQVSGGGAQGVMTAVQIAQFVQYFQRLTEHSLATLPTYCDTVFSLDANRCITATN